MDFLKSTIASAISSSASLTASANSLAGGFSVGKQIDLASDEIGAIWTLNEGIKRDDSSKCSIFTFEFQNHSPAQAVLARNAFRKMRTLLLPGILKAIATFETDRNLTIVTERVIPLREYLQNALLSKTSKVEDEIWGVFQISSTLKTINQQAQCIHGNVRISSVFVNDKDEWKLFGLEVISVANDSSSSTNNENQILYTHGAALPGISKYEPPELTQATSASTSWDVLKRYPSHCLDAYQLGCFIYELFSGNTPHRSRLASDSKSIPRTMLQVYRRLIATTPRQRISAAQFVEQGLADKSSGSNHGFFHIDLIDIAIALDHLSLLNETEISKFLTKLTRVLFSCPAGFLVQKVLPELVRAIDFSLGKGGASASNPANGGEFMGISTSSHIQSLISTAVKISDNLDQQSFETQMTPLILKLFIQSRRDRMLRIILLDNFSIIVDKMTPKTVCNKLFSEFAYGFNDGSPAIREQTVKSVLIIIGKLNDRLVNADLLRYLARTQQDQQPGIRVNATICLGKIAEYLGQNNRSKVLLSAFSRASKDQFIPCRTAAIQALSATLSYYTAEECADRVIPILSGCLLDPDSRMRSLAWSSMDQVLTKIREKAKSIPDTTENEEEAQVRDDSSFPKPKSSWTDWAMSSFSHKAGSLDNLNSEVPTPTSTPTVSSSPFISHNGSARRSSLGILPLQNHNNIESDDNLMEEENDDDNDADAWAPFEDEEQQPQEVEIQEEDAWGSDGWEANNNNNDHDDDAQLNAKARGFIKRQQKTNNTTITSSIGSGKKTPVVVQQQQEEEEVEEEQEEDGWGDDW